LEASENLELEVGQRPLNHRGGPGGVRVFGILATAPHNACFTASFNRPTYIIAIRKIKKITIPATPAHMTPLKIAVMRCIAR
jgi:hypothetical protein